MSRFKLDILCIRDSSIHCTATHHRVSVNSASNSVESQREGSVHVANCRVRLDVGAYDRLRVTDSFLFLPINIVLSLQASLSRQLVSLVCALLGNIVNTTGSRT